VRAKAIVAFLAAIAVAALLLLPAIASAKPGFDKVPAFHSTGFAIRGANGSFIFVSVRNGTATLVAEREIDSDGAATAIYRQTSSQGPGNDLHVDFGRAGALDARFVPGGTQEREPQEGCAGGPTVSEAGYFVGSMSFRAAAGFTSFRAHRVKGGVIRAPAETCRTASIPGLRAFRELQDGILRLIGGDPAGKTAFQATTFPALGGEPARPQYLAYSERTEGSLYIRDSVTVPTPRASPFAVPDLTATLPATATIEPPFPFSGSATFEAPSRRTATLAGDLSAELPEVGTVALAGPGTAAGLCHGHTCTKSLPKPLRPSRIGTSYEVQTIH
jgi:hypothetical protein